MLNTEQWSEFYLRDLFEIKPGQYHSKDEYSIGKTPYVTASANNNGIAQRINLNPDFKGNSITTGKVGCTAFYQIEDFCASSDVNIFSAIKFEMNNKIGVFITAIINFSENYKWTYGRQCRVGDSKKIKIKLPIKLDEKGNPVIDESNNYNHKGHIPDFAFMSKFNTNIETRKTDNSKSIANSLKSKNINKRVELKTENWQEFFLHKLFHIKMGNGIDANKTTSFDPKYNYVSRDSNGNGVVAFVDEIKDEMPFPAGSMTVSLGGSFLGSTFIQKEAFYTAQNVAVMQEKVELSVYMKLFISSLIRNECKVKYLAFGRELNSHIKKDFTIKLPVLKLDQKIVLDKTKSFSELGLVPDWDLMESKIKELPYGDRI